MDLKERVNKEFHHAKKRINYITGLKEEDFNLLELATLRRLTEHCVEQGTVGGEAGEMFLQQVLGYVSDNDLEQKWYEIEMTAGVNAGYSIRRSYFKRKLEDTRVL